MRMEGDLAIGRWVDNTSGILIKPVSVHLIGYTRYDQIILISIAIILVKRGECS
jgi:hypothetical protein